MFGDSGRPDGLVRCWYYSRLQAPVSFQRSRIITRVSIYGSSPVHVICGIFITPIVWQWCYYILTTSMRWIPKINAWEICTKPQITMGVMVTPASGQRLFYLGACFLSRYDVIFDCTGDDPEQYMKLLKKHANATYVTIVTPLMRNTDQFGILLGGLKSAITMAACTSMVSFLFFTQKLKVYHASICSCWIFDKHNCEFIFCYCST